MFSCQHHSSAFFVRVMLYRIYKDLRKDELAKMKFLLDDKLGRKQTEMCSVRTKLSFTPHHSNKLILLSNMEKYCWIVFFFTLEPIQR